MSSLDDAVNMVFEMMEQDSAIVEDAVSYLAIPIRPPPHWKF